MCSARTGEQKAMPSTSFADRLREARETAGMSQYALAKKSGLSKQALSNLEAGNREPTWQTVQLLAAALGVDCTSFVDPTLKMPEETPAAAHGRPRKSKPTPAKKTKTRKGK
jgi:transcriptional regulator with XRE-family HTH domain